MNELLQAKAGSVRSSRSLCGSEAVDCLEDIFIVVLLCHLFLAYF